MRRSTLTDSGSGKCAERVDATGGFEAFAVNPNREHTGTEDTGKTRRVEAFVVAVVPEYHQVMVRDADGHLYSLTRKTRGIDLAALCEGQRVVCTVTRRLPRVLTAAIDP